MADLRELRLAIEKKLNERKELLSERSHHRTRANNAEAAMETQSRLMKAAVVNYALEDCADQIIRQILDEALKASMIVANETFGTGEYEVGIDIPSLHIRHRIYRPDFDMMRVYEHSPTCEPSIKRVRVDTSDYKLERTR